MGGGESCIINIHLGVSQVRCVKLNNMRGEVRQSEELHLKVLWRKSALKIMRQPKNNDIQRQFCSNSVSHSFFSFFFYIMIMLKVRRNSRPATRMMTNTVHKVSVRSCITVCCHSVRKKDGISIKAASRE